MKGETVTITVNELSQLRSTVKRLTAVNAKLQAQNEALENVIAKAMRTGDIQQARGNTPVQPAAPYHPPAPVSSFDPATFLLLGESLGLAIGESCNNDNQTSYDQGSCTNDQTPTG